MLLFFALPCIINYLPSFFFSHRFQIKSHTLWNYQKSFHQTNPPIHFFLAQLHKNHGASKQRIAGSSSQHFVPPLVFILCQRAIYNIHVSPYVLYLLSNLTWNSVQLWYFANCSSFGIFHSVLVLKVSLKVLCSCSQQVTLWGINQKKINGDSSRIQLHCLYSQSAI